VQEIRSVLWNPGSGTRLEPFFQSPLSPETDGETGCDLPVDLDPSRLQDIGLVRHGAPVVDRQSGLPCLCFLCDWNPRGHP
jgi:hypothetical protein